MTTSHPLEIVFLMTSLFALSATAFIVSLKLTDLLIVWRAKLNGPVLFMKKDNIRQQSFMMAMASGMLMLSISGVNNKDPVTPQTLNLMAGASVFAVLITVDALYMYRRRWKLAALITEYEAGLITPLPGGKRSYDPPLTVIETEQ